MKVAGFTFVRNAILYDYPIVEAINSILPICDELHVAVGQSDDKTLELIQSITSQKINILPTIWDDRKREGGAVLALETNKAFDAISDDADWCFYIQGDEVLHEKYLPLVRASMEENLDNKKVEGLLFDYQHFYGSYDFVGDSRRWYRQEVRVIRNDKRIRSWKDAQGFRKEGRKLKVRKSGASIYHYGWVKHPSMQQAKQRNFNKYWHDEDWIKNNVANVAQFDYSQIDALKRFETSHPKVMQLRIAEMNWRFNFDPSQRKWSVKEKFSRAMEQLTGKRIGEYRNFELLD